MLDEVSQAQNDKCCTVCSCSNVKPKQVDFTQESKKVGTRGREKGRGVEKKGLGSGGKMVKHYRGAAQQEKQLLTYKTLKRNYG